MPRVENQQVDLPENSATSRRRLLTSLLAGGAFAAAAPMLATRASASDGTPAPPNRDKADNATLNALVRREDQMVATYAAAVKATKNADDVAALTLIHDHHVAYVQALAGYLGRDAVATGNGTPLAGATGSFASNASQLANLETATMNQHVDALNSLNGLNAATLVASIITMEARHSAALALVSGLAPLTAAGN
jgi:hypothetical protein